MELLAQVANVDAVNKSFLVVSGECVDLHKKISLMWLRISHKGVGAT